MDVWFLFSSVSLDCCRSSRASLACLIVLQVLDIEVSRSLETWKLFIAECPPLKHYVLTSHWAYTFFSEPLFLTFSRPWARKYGSLSTSCAWDTMRIRGTISGDLDHCVEGFLFSRRQEDCCLDWELRCQVSRQKSIGHSYCQLLSSVHWSWSWSLSLPDVEPEIVEGRQWCWLRSQATVRFQVANKVELDLCSMESMERRLDSLSLIKNLHAFEKKV